MEDHGHSHLPFANLVRVPRVFIRSTAESLCRKTRLWSRQGTAMCSTLDPACTHHGPPLDCKALHVPWSLPTKCCRMQGSPWRWAWGRWLRQGWGWSSCCRCGEIQIQFTFKGKMSTYNHVDVDVLVLVLSIWGLNCAFSDILSVYYTQWCDSENHRISCLHATLHVPHKSLWCNTCSENHRISCHHATRHVPQMLSCI